MKKIKLTWRNLEILFDFSKWILKRKSIKEYLLEQTSDFLCLLWKGLGFVIGFFMAIQYHWGYLVLLLVWLMFDVKVELTIRKKKE